jgi:hypothetical protein
MAQEKTLGRSGGEAHTPSEVQITITVVPHRHRWSLCARLPGTTAILAGCAAGFGLAAAVFGPAMFRTAEVGGGRTPNRIHAAGQDRGGVAGVAAAYGYPPRCVSVTIAAGAPTYAQAELDRRPACAAYHGYVNATFHRVDGKWRLVLDEGQLFVPDKFLARCRAAWPSCQPLPRGAGAARAPKRPHS